MADPAILNEVSADRIRAHIEKIVREIPHRAAGSANGKRMAEYSRDAMQANGLADVTVHELPAIVSFPEHAEFRIEVPVATAIQANTLGHSLLTPAEGLRGDRRRGPDARWPRPREQQRQKLSPIGSHLEKRFVEQMFLKIAAPNPLCEEILSVTGVGRHFDTFRDPTTAVGSFIQ